MVKVAPFHARLPGTTAHHDNDHCDEGNDIPIQDRQAGTGDLPLCETCARLDRTA